MNEVRLISSVSEIINRTSVHRGQKQRREEQWWHQSRTSCTCSDRKVNWKGNLQLILSSWRGATTAPCLCCVSRAKTHCNKFRLGKQLLILWPSRDTQNLSQLFFHSNTVFSLLKLELDKRAGSDSHLMHDTCVVPSTVTSSAPSPNNEPTPSLRSSRRHVDKQFNLLT